MKALTTIIMSVVVTALAVTLSASDKVRELKLQQAIDLIESRGDLAKATPLLEDVARSTDRELAARGLLHLAQAQERFGKSGALATYERLVKNFGDMNEPAALVAAVTTARAKLGAVGQRTAGLVARQVWQQSGIGYYAYSAAVSPDGRSIAYADWNTGDLGVHDLATGHDQLLTSDMLRTETFVEDMVFSPDSTLIAYGVDASIDVPYELRVVNRTGGQPRVVRRAVNPGDKLYVQGWHPDGKQILITEGPDGGRSRKKLLLVPLDGGPPRTVLEQYANVGGLFKVSPDGRYVTYTKRQSGVGDIVSISLETGQEQVVHHHPADDRLLNWHPSGDRLFFLSDRGGSWGIWGVSVVKGIAQGDATLVRADTGLIESVGFTRDGDFYYDRHVTENEVYIADLRAASDQRSALTRVESRFQGFKSRAEWSPTGDRLAYVQVPVNPRPGSAAAQTIVIQNTGTQEAKSLDIGIQTIFTLAWLPDGRHLVVQGTVKDQIGLFQVDDETGDVTPLATKATRADGPTRIQPATSRENNQLFFRTRPEAGIFSRDLESGSERQVTSENPASYAVSPGGAWLALTRQGKGADLDVLVVPSTGGPARTIATFPSGWTRGSGLSWAADGQSVLVASRGTGGVEIFRVTLDGKAPISTGIRWSGNIGGISAHPNGRELALSTVRLTGETWVLQNIPR